MKFATVGLVVGAMLISNTALLIALVMFVVEPLGTQQESLKRDLAARTGALLNKEVLLETYRMDLRNLSVAFNSTTQQLRSTQVELGAARDRAARSPFLASRPPSTPPSDAFYEAIVRSQNPAECHPASLIELSLKMPLGFGYLAHRVVDCVLYAHSQGKTCVLDPQHSIGMYGTECGTSWDCFFEPISKCQGVKGGKRTDAKTPKEWLPENVPDGLLNPGAWVIGTALKYILKPNARLQAVLDARVVTVNYGVHVRRGDKVASEAWAHELEQYQHALDRVTNPSWNFHSAYGLKYGKSVYLATDDKGVIQEMSRCWPQYKTYSGDGPTYTRHARDGLDSLMVDLFSLASGEYFVGTFSSQVSRMVYELMHTRFQDAYHRAWSLDDPWYGNGYAMVNPS